MSQNETAWLGLTLMLASMLTPGASAELPQIAVGVLDFHCIDTSGEARDQSAPHEAWLKDFMNRLRTDLQSSSRFKVVPLTCGASECSLIDTEPAELVASADRAGARLLLFGGIHKESTLVQWAKVQVLDVHSKQLVFDRLLTFRGDDQSAWRHAESFVVKELSAHPWPR